MQVIFPPTALQVVVGAIPAAPSLLGRVIVDGQDKEKTVVRLDGIESTPQIDIPSADRAIVDLNDNFQKPVVAFNTASRGTVSGAFSPQYGSGTGVILDHNTLNGLGNDWRGQFNIEHLNSALNARNYFDYLGEDDIRRTRFGAKVGGPLHKNKDGSAVSSVYFAYDGLRGRTERSIFEAIPQEALCKCGVTGLPGTLLGNYLPAGTSLRPNHSGDSAFVLAERRGRVTVKMDAFNVRLDQKLKENVSLLLRYTPQFSTSYLPDGITGRRQKQQISFHNFGASLSFATGVLNVHTIRFGLNRPNVEVSSENSSALSPELTQAAFNITGNVPITGLPGLSAVPVASVGALIKGIQGRGYYLTPVTYTLGYDNVIGTGPWINKDKLIKKYTFYYGLEGRFMGFNFDRQGGITYSFANLNAFRAGTPTATNFLSDLSGTSPFTSGTGPRHARQNYFLSYFQMRTILLDKALTLTFGVRYDYFGSVNERDDRTFLIDPETGTILPSSTPLYRALKNNLQPRFGFSYKIDRDGFFKNTEIAAGAGIYSVSPKISELLLPIESDRLNTSTSGGNFAVTMNDALQSFKQQALTRQFQPLAFSRQFQLPERIYKCEASFKRPLWVMYDFGVSYAGVAGRNLPFARVGNKIVSVSTNADPTKPADIIREFDTVSNGQVSKPYGEFFYRSSEGYFNYNALTVSFGKNKVKEGITIHRWLRMTSLSAQYTYAVSKGNISSAPVSNPFNADADYGYNAGASATVPTYRPFTGFGRHWAATVQACFGTGSLPRS